MLKHYKYDGLDAVLEAYGLDKDGVEAVRAARIVTVVDSTEDGNVLISTSDADSEGEANTVTFTPGVTTNITNPLNGEQVEVRGKTLLLYFYIYGAVPGHRVIPQHVENQVHRPGHKHRRDKDLALHSGGRQRGKKRQ